MGESLPFTVYFLIFAMAKCKNGEEKFAIYAIDFLAIFAIDFLAIFAMMAPFLLFCHQFSRQFCTLTMSLDTERQLFLWYPCRQASIIPASGCRTQYMGTQ